MDFLVEGKRLRVDARALIGQGGEAEVYDLADGRVLKRFKPASHADFAGFPDAQLAATSRIAEHARKLPALMRRALPACVVSPLALAEQKGALAGYVMKRVDGAVLLSDHAQASIRRAMGGGARNLDVLRALAKAVAAIHASGVVIGDFNDNNVLVRGDDVRCIDADSYQFDRFACRVFSERFVDPRLCAEASGAITLVRPHDEGSDWYAFAVIAMQLLLLAGPYSGVYRPRPGALRLPPSLRPLERITVFHADVQYPKPALPLSTLPDALLSAMEGIFVHHDRRPLDLSALRFTRCSQCGAEHARAVCPACTTAKNVVHRTTVRGRVTERLLLRTEGTIVAASAEHWLVHENGAFVRETKDRVLIGALDPRMSFALLPRATLVGHDRKLAILGGVNKVRSIAKGAFAAHGSRAVFVSGDSLVRDDDEVLGGVLENDARVWLGAKLGFGLYRAGELAVGYVFSPEKKGILDCVRPACVRGRVLEVGCAIGDFVWLCVAREENGRRVDACLLVDASGRVLAAAEGDARNEPWLASAKNGAAVGNALLVPTDHGIVRVNASGGALAVTHAFADTEPFVDAASRLIATPQALLVHDAHELRALTMEVTS